MRCVTTEAADRRGGVSVWYDRPEIGTGAARYGYPTETGPPVCRRLRARGPVCAGRCS